MRLFSLAKLALLASALSLLPGAALAAAATASQDVNVRSGPAASYGVVGQLHRGDAVDVRQCEGLFCQVNYATGSGWVSASFLVRGPATPTPVAPTVATAQPTTPQVPTPAAPRSSVIASTLAPPTATPKPAASTVVASTAVPAASKPAATPALPLGAFPPAYTDTAGLSPAAAGTAPSDNFASNDDGSSDDDSIDDNGPRSSVTLPDDSGDTIASTDDDGAPRPKADVPGGLQTGPDDDSSLGDGGGDNPAGADLADVPSDDGFNAPPAADWRADPRFVGRHAGWRDRFGGGPRLAACFFGDTGFGGSGFCLRPGQSMADLGGWSDRIFALRNPDGLRVTVCSAAPDRPCRVYDRSGPLGAAGDAGIASIRVDAPGY